MGSEQLLGLLGHILLEVEGSKVGHVLILLHGDPLLRQRHHILGKRLYALMKWALGWWMTSMHFSAPLPKK